MQNIKSLRQQLALMLCVFTFFTFSASFGQNTAIIGSTSGETCTDCGPLYVDSLIPLKYSRYAVNYSATELAAIPVGATITKIEWLRDSGSTISGANKLDIWLCNNPPLLSSGFIWRFLKDISTKVYSSTAQSIAGANQGAASVWVACPLTTGFVYTGQGNLMIMTDWTRSTLTRNAVKWRMTPANDKGIGGAGSAVYDDFLPIDLQNYHRSNINVHPTLRITYTPPTCVPKELIINNITSSTASLSWSLPNLGSPTNYTWRVVKADTPTTVVATGMTPNLNATITGLAANTNYIALVESNCNTFEASIPFKTICGTVTTYPWKEDFETDVATCGTSVGWTIEGFGARNAPYFPYDLSRKYALYQVTDSALVHKPFYVTLPAFALGNTAKSVKYHYWLGREGYQGTTDSSGVDPSPLELQISINNGITWTPLYKHTTLNTAFATDAYDAWNNVRIDLSAYANQTVQLRFQGRSNLRYEGTNYFWFSGVAIDEITVENLPVCASPSQPIMSNITGSTAQLNWTQTGTATTWDVYYKEYNLNGEQPSDTTTPSATISQRQYTITGLKTNTVYYAWVRAHCAGTVRSEWTSVVAFQTSCTYVSTFPWTEGFENGTFLDCLIDPTKNQWKIAEADGNGADFGNDGTLKFAGIASYGHTDDPSLYLKMPSFTLGSTPKQFKYFYWLGTEGYHGTTGRFGADPYPLELELSTNNGATWTAIYSHAPSNSTFNARSTDIWRDVIIDLSAYANQTIQLRFKGRVTNRAGVTNMGVDDVTMENLSACQRPSTPSVSNVTATTAKLNWGQTGTPTAWEVYYSKSYVAPTATTTPLGTATQANYTFTNLSANTIYYAWVRARCSATEKSNWSILTPFKTSCSNISAFPWTEGFESDPLCSINTAFTNTVPAKTSWWDVSERDDNGSEVGHNGSAKFARLDAVTNRFFDYAQTLNLPTFTLGATPKTLKYYYWLGENGYKGTTGSTGTDPYPLQCQISTDSGLTWTSLVNHSTANTVFNNTNFRNWQKQKLDLVAYANKTVHLRFVGWSRQYGDYFNTNIDDLSISNTPDCTEPIYTNAFILDTSARINWRQSDSSNVALWDVYYSKDGIEPSSTAVPNATTPNKFYTLTGLTADSIYTVWVRARCNSSVASVTDWTEMLTFTAPCRVVSTFPFKEGFNTGVLTNCWTTGNDRGAIWSCATDFNTFYNPTNALEGSGFAYLIPSSFGGTLTNPYTLQSPVINLGTTPKRLKFNYWIGKHIYANDTIPLTVEISTDNGVSFSLLKAFKTPKASKWTYQALDLAAYANKLVVIRFSGYINEIIFGGTIGNIALDNFRIEALDCALPTATTVSNITSKSANISWTQAAGTATSWDMYYSTSDTIPSDTARATLTNITTNTNYNLTGLEGGSTYQIWIRSNCGNGQHSDWAAPSVFSTNCSYSELAEKFEQDTILFNPLLPKCWQKIEKGVNASVNPISTGFDYRIKGGVRLDIGDSSANIAMLIMPQLTNLRAGTHRLRFQTGHSYDTSLELGYMTSSTDTASFRVLKTYAMDTLYSNERTFAPSTTLPLTARHLAFKIKGDNYAFINFDDIYWEKIPTCNDVVTNLRAKATLTTAKFTWSPPSVNRPVSYDWQIVKDVSVTFGVADTVVKSGNTTDTSVVVTGLAIGQSYIVRLRPRCSDTTNFHWSLGEQFYTPLSNDACSGAIPLVLGAAPVLVHAGLADEGVPVPIGPAPVRIGARQTDGYRNDVWYSFKTPATETDKLSIAPNSTGFYNDWVMAVYKGGCPPVGKQVSYSDDVSSDLKDVPIVSLCGYAPNTTYYIRLFPFYGYSTDDTCRLSVISDAIGCLPRPANDSCSQAVTLLENTEIAGTNEFVTPDLVANPTQDPYGNINDVWYKFNSGTGANRIINAEVALKYIETYVGSTIRFAVYKGTCNGLTQITNEGTYAYVKKPYNFNAPTNRENDTLFIRGLEENQDYYIRAWSNGDYLRASIVTGRFFLKLIVKNRFSSSQVATTHAKDSCAPFTTITIDSTNNMRWVPIMDSTNLVAEIRGNGNNLGDVSGAYYRHTTGTVRTANSAYLNRNIAFTVDRQPITPVSVRIYITAAEWNALAAIYPSITPTSFSLHRVQGVICSNVYIGGTMQEIINGATRNNFGSDYYLEYQTPGFSQFFITAPNAPIPVELKSFTAVAKEKVNAIQWQTATELNVNKFIIERSNNGVTNWLSIGEEKAVGNSTSLQTYNLTDNDPLSMSYYRLRTVDVNGKESLSNTVSVARKVGRLNITNVFPVPTSNDVNVQFEAKNNEQIELIITTITGQVVAQSKITAKEGFNTQTISMINFENGLYFISLSNGVDKVLHRIVKQ